MNTIPRDGLLLIDKPRGITSRRAVDRVMQRLGAARAGHCGTLDPAATGLLVVGYGRATRTLGHLTGQRKRYEACLRLGVKTSTADAEGEVIERRPVAMPGREALEAALAAFTGEIMQRPPMYSAVRHGGQRLYRLARANQVVAREPRCVHVYAMRLDHVSGDGFCFTVECSKGTYIRVLAEDLGTHLGTVAHLSELRRTAIGPFSVERALSPEQIDEHDDAALAAQVLPPDSGFPGMPEVVLDAAHAGRFCLGQTVGFVTPQPGGFRVYDENRRFLGIATGDGQLLHPKRVFA